MIPARLAPLLVVLAGCGGGTSPTPPPAPPPPPPPPAPTPASVAIEAGNQQTAAAGAAVGVAPAVVVRDAQNRVLAGITVQFAVTEGGGSVEGASPVTDAAGVARVTRWTLGPSGAQQLSAQVAALPPALFQASLLPGTETIDVGLPPTGGSHEITAAEHPYRGLKLTVPAGALSAPASWQFRVVTPATPPTLPPGYQVAGPVLEVLTEQPRTERLMTLDIPITTPAGRAVLIALHDPARGVMEIIPAVARTATSIRVVTTHLRADLLLGPAPASVMAGAAGSLRLPGVGQLFPISFPIPQADVAPLMDPASDRWPVLENGSAESPAGHGPAIAGFEALNLALSGPRLASFVKGLEEKGFYAEPAPLGALVSAGQRLLNGLSNVLNELNESLRALPKAQRDELVSQSLNANLAVRGVTPVAFTTPSNGGVAFANAFGAGGGTTSLVSAASAAVLTLGRNPTTGFDPQTVKPTVDATPTSTDGVSPLPSLVLAYEKLGDLLSDLQRLPILSPEARATLNRAMADAAGLPEVQLEARALVDGAWDAVKDDRLVLRARQTTIRIPFLGGGVMVNFPSSGAEAARSTTTTLAIGDVPAIKDLPERVKTPVTFSLFRDIAGSLKQVAVQVIDLLRAPFKVSPVEVTLDADREVVFEAEVPEPPTSGFRIRWEWGDGETSENLGLTTGTHTYEAAGDYTVISKLLSQPAGVVLAVDTVEVKSSPLPFWRITSISDPDELLDSEEAGNPFQDMIRRLLAVPQSALIAIEAEGGGKTVVRLRVLPAATWSEANCCPPPLAPFPGELRQSLGEQPTIVYPVGPFFAGYGTTEWSQSTTDLGAGTLTGQFVANGTEPRSIKDAGVQIAPKDFIRITATRNGTIMTGTITVVAWFQDEETGEIDDDLPTTFDLPFTAVRLR